MTRVFVALSLLVSAVHAQSGMFEQDSALDNLHHAVAYTTAPLGTLGAVVRRGTGNVDVLIIPGWGFGAGTFDRFMRANDTRYRMVAVTLPGFANTPAPPMPASGVSYGDATWTRAAEEALVQLIRSEGLRKPIVLGHFVVGTQLALRLALDHPELVGGVVIVGGEPMRYLKSRRDTSGKTFLSPAQRVAGVDTMLAPRWYKTVTKRTWLANNYAAAQYAADSARAAELWEASSEVPLPVMIRYLCEYYTMDFTAEWAKLTVPVRVLVPEFTPAILSDAKQSYVRTLFHDSWDMVRGASPLISIERVPDSRIFITDDRPDVVRAALDDLGRRRP